VLFFVKQRGCWGELKQPERHSLNQRNIFVALKLKIGKMI